MSEPVHDPRFDNLLAFLRRIPAVEVNDTASGGFGWGIDEEVWWVKFSIHVDHALAWNTVQELGHVLNYHSVSERLPTTFKPVSPPPYMNGGPRDFLSWVIECPDGSMSPSKVAECLERRLPQPVEEAAAWTETD